MSLKGLIEKQTIIIDDHKRGNGEVKNWDDTSIDIHIDKTTNFPVEGKIQNLRIRIPINSDRPIKICSKKLSKIPRLLKNEIRIAFSDSKKRGDFIHDIIEILKGFKTILTNETRVKKVLEKLSKHFELEWTQDNIATYANNALQQYSQNYKGANEKEYFITIDSKKIKIGEGNIYSRHQKHQYI